jgi:3-hydroxyisobutyrate dehydrogenase
VAADWFVVAANALPLKTKRSKGINTMQVTAKTYALAAPQRVAFLGLGVMGAPMAAHLAHAGHHVTVYNRTSAKAAQWLELFGSVGQGRHQAALTPREAVVDADVVCSCVGNDADLLDVVLGPMDAHGQRTGGGLSNLRRGSTWMDHTTASAQVARQLHAQAQERGVAFIDAPVSGGQAGAQNGALTVMCGGTQAAVELAQPIALAYAKSYARMGDSGAGQLAKMVNQICIAGLVQALSEGIAFGQQAGLDMHKVLEVIGKGAAQSWQMDNRGKTMADGSFDFGFAVDWMRKDLGLVLDEAKRNGARVPVTALVDQFYADVQRMGGQRWDTSSLIERLR